MFPSGAADAKKDLVDLMVDPDVGDVLEIFGRGVPARGTGVSGHLRLAGAGHCRMPGEWRRVALDFSSGFVDGTIARQQHESDLRFIVESLGAKKPD